MTEPNRPTHRFRGPEHLSPREEEAVKLAKEGKTAKEVAEVMGITRRYASQLISTGHQKVAIRQVR